MRTDEVQDILSRHSAELATMGVRSLSVFGSVARNEAGRASDVDLLVEFARPTGVFGLVRLHQFLESILGVPVDLGTPQSLKPSLRNRVLAESVRVA